MFDICRYEDIYEALKFMYTDWPDVEDLEKNRAMFGDVCYLGAMGWI